MSKSAVRATAHDWDSCQPICRRMAKKYAYKLHIDIEDMMHEALWVFYDCSRKYTPDKGPFANYLSRALHNQFLWFRERWHKHWEHNVYLCELNEEVVATAEDHIGPKKRYGDFLDRLSKESLFVVKIATNALKEGTTLSLDDLRSALLSRGCGESYVNSLFSEIQGAFSNE